MILSYQSYQLVKKQVVFTFGDCARARPRVPHTPIVLSMHRDSVTNSFVPEEEEVERKFNCVQLSLGRDRPTVLLHDSTREYKGTQSC